MAGETLLENFCRTANVPLFVRKLEEHYHDTLGKAAAGRLYQGVLWKTTVDTLRDFTELSGLRLGEMVEKAVFNCLQWCLHDTLSRRYRASHRGDGIHSSARLFAGQ